MLGAIWEADSQETIEGWDENEGMEGEALPGQVIFGHAWDRGPSNGPSRARWRDILEVAICRVRGFDRRPDPGAPSDITAAGQSAIDGHRRVGKRSRYR